MGRPKALDTIDACQTRLDEIDRERAKIAKQLRKIEEEDNVRLGGVVRKVFKDVMPQKKGDQLAFFKALLALYNANVPKVSDTDVSGDTAVVKTVNQPDEILNESQETDLPAQDDSIMQSGEGD